jgi:pimeloyl-ACP methyl ester carboxylesterase
MHVNAATVGFMPFPPLPEAELAELTDAERARVERIAAFMADEFGVEKVQAWTHGSEVPEDAVDRDRLLTNVMVYWLTRTAGSSASIYDENQHAGGWPAPNPAPTGVAVFAEDIAIRRYAEQGNNIVHWSEFDGGGHFAALEAPDLLVGDVRAFYRRLR